MADARADNPDVLAQAAIQAPGPDFAVAFGSDTDRRDPVETEWLLAAGNGSFAMGTTSGVPTRRYHALLNAAQKPPVGRIVALHQMHESLVLTDPDGETVRRVTLSAYQMVDSKGRIGEIKVNPWLVRFEKDRTTARWIYRVDDVEVIKELRVGFRSVQAAVRYTVRTDRSVRLEVRPLVTLRDMHDIGGQRDPAEWHVKQGESLVTVFREEPKKGEPAPRPAVHLAASGAEFQAGREMLRGVRYRIEAERGAERGKEDWEDLFVPGRFEAAFAGGAATGRMTIALSINDTPPDLKLFDQRAAQTYLEATIQRALSANKGLAGCATLVLAADAFLVERSHKGDAFTTVIAGYPWFADWGRDAMISLPGLMLTTGRLSEARATLEVFARYLSRGMIPNHFDDSGGPPSYNTVDASLWFLHAAADYVRVTSDMKFYNEHLHLACWQIIEYYQSGTRYGIKMDPEDALIESGDETTQLTWMDAKRDGEVFTPRHGKAVEINALWYSGLLSIAELSEGVEPDRATRYRELAARVRESFAELFWDEDRQALFDCLQRPEPEEPWGPTDEVRPNQIFAVSLPHSPLTRHQQRGVIEEVTRELLTPHGLRTLAPGGERYQPRFEGDMMSRDRAYHNGTVWPWLIGPYAEALLRYGQHSDLAREQARRAIQPLIDSLDTGCLGQICEVLDADEPRRQQGCVAQAWSVAEVLRVAAMAGAAPRTAAQSTG